MQGLSRRRAAALAGTAIVAVLVGAAAREINPGLRSRCEAAGKVAEAAEKDLLGKTLGWLDMGFTGATSTIGDRFSISGKEGPFICSAKVAEREAANRARRKLEAEAALKAKTGGGPVRTMNLAAQADVSGRLRPSLFHMPETERRLQVIVDDIARAWPYPGMGRVTVLVSANLHYNAEARADNTMVVWLGALADSEGGISKTVTDSDLYWLLGHEYAHLALGHMQSHAAGETQRRFLHDAGRMYQRGAMLASSIHYAEASPSAQDADLKESYRDANDSHRHLRFMLDRIVYPMWGRMQEDEADAAGIDIAFLAGVPPRYPPSIDQFEATETDLKQRIETVQDNMAQRADKVLNDPRFKAAIDGGDLSTAYNAVFDSLKKGLYEGLRRWFTELVGRDHRSASARRDGLGRYVQAAYLKPKLMPTDPSAVDEVTKGLRDLPELRDAITAARAVDAAERALNALPTDKAEAARQIAIALKGPFGRECYVRVMAAEIALANGRTTEAINHLEVAIKAQHRSPDAYRELIRLYARSGQLPRARALIVEGRKVIGDSDYFLPSDIRVQVRARQFDALEKTFEACRASNRDRIMVDCQSAALDVDYDKLTEKDRARLEELAFWGEKPKAQKGPKVPSRVPSIPMPWKRGR